MDASASRDMSRVGEAEDRVNSLLKNEPRVVGVDARGHEHLGSFACVPARSTAPMLALGLSWSDR